MRLKKTLTWIGLVVLALMLLFLITLYSLTSMVNGNEKRTAEYFKKAGVDYQSENLIWKERSIKVIRSGNLDSKKMIFFIHGAPGGSKDFSAFLTDSLLLESAQLVAYDRPGYGSSNYGEVMRSVEEQTEVAEMVMNHWNADSIIVVGYSYGGPISGALAASGNPKIKGLVMLAPANSPEAEPIFWFNKLINHKLVALILPNYIIVANREKFARPIELQKIESEWAKIKVPMYHFHCSNDWIAPFEGNTKFVAQRVNSNLLTEIYWDGDSHFLPNTQLDRVRPVLLRLLG